MAEIIASAENTIFLSQEHVLYCETIVPFYGTMDEAIKYFGTRLNSDAWDESDDTNRRKALITATRAIDRLNFYGEKASESQGLQFPRADDVHVPAEIKIAVFEEALSLLDGVDPQLEFSGLSAESRGIASVRTTYDRTVVPENIVAGITSIIAWRYLVPYLRDPGELTLSRV